MPKAYFRRLTVALIVLGSCTSSAQTSSLQLSSSYVPALGHTLVTLSGQIRYCDPALGGFVGGPTFVVSIDSINVRSSTFSGECPPPPPGFIVPPPVPFEISANIGHVPDGTYTVIWSLTNIDPPGIVTTRSTTINVINGPPVNARSINSLSSWGLATLAMALSVLAALNRPKQA